MLTRRIIKFENRFAIGDVRSVGARTGAYSIVLCLMYDVNARSLNLDRSIGRTRSSQVEPRVLSAQCKTHLAAILIGKRNNCPVIEKSQRVIEVFRSYRLNRSALLVCELLRLNVKFRWVLRASSCHASFFFFICFSCDEFCQCATSASKIFDLFPSRRLELFQTELMERLLKKGLASYYI